MLKILLVCATTITTLTGPLLAAAAARQNDHTIALQTTPAAPAAPGQASPNPPPSRQPQQFVNIRLDLTISITDQRGASTAPQKVVTMYMVDRDPGRLRTGAGAPSTPRSSEGAPALLMPARPLLNVDATPEILSNGRVRVRLSLEYRPASSESGNLEPIHINEVVGAILEDGKPLVVSQTADPASDRIVKVELKATISK